MAFNLTSRRESSSNQTFLIAVFFQITQFSLELEKLESLTFLILIEARNTKSHEICILTIKSSKFNLQLDTM